MIEVKTWLMPKMTDSEEDKPADMAAQFAAAGIKLEGTEIQTYLETFNKEIEGGVTQITVDDSDNEDQEGTYFIDQSGHYYYQANPDSQPVMTVVQGAPQEDGEDGGSVLPGDCDPGIINDGYQTVTIVQSDSNPGEVSYVLIMPQRDKGKDEDGEDIEINENDLAVYDFDENEEVEEGLEMDSGAEDDKSKILKIIPKKSQIVAQAHMCNYCNYTSPKRYLLSRHMKSHSEERPHKCSVCERGFKTLASLQNHVNTHTGTKPHHCKYCESAFTTSGELVRHVRYRHTHEKPHKCHECDYASVELSKLKRHIRCHTGERPYQCPHCTYASPDTFKLKRHLRIHTGEKPYGCDICQARFTQSNSLKAHKLIHNVQDKPVFQCELCPTTCGRKTDLRIHVQKLHTSDTPLKCKRCGKSFPDRYSFKLHTKTHEGEKCYKCDLCVYASISARHLESHMLIHTDQKPYKCDQCDQSFRQKQLLKRHQNLYHNPEYVPPPPKEKTHQCPECERVFRHKGNLIRHMAVHDPESSIQEKALALKMGRQKKIHIIDGQKIEVMPSLDYDTDDSDQQEMVAVEGTDGQQYVVLEVIQIQDEDGHDEMVQGILNREAEEDEVSTRHLEGDFLLPEPLDEEEMLNSLRSSRKVIHNLVQSTDATQDMQNCFGFDDEEDDEDAMQTEVLEDESEDEGKDTIQLIDMAE